MQRLKLIAFAGFKGSGKTSAAQHLESNYAYYRTNFAWPLKEFCRVIGLTDEDLNEGKDKPHPFLGGKTPRDFQKAVGTDAGRELIWEDIWVDVHRRRIESLLSGGICVVNDDVRMENELRSIRELGGIVVWVNRPGVTSDGHKTEQDIRHLCDFEIDNGGTLPALWEAVEHIAIKKK